ncbi:fibronectin type III domain-containing protein 4 isoform X2 [Syngnathus acus]|uniref:fibronectin type III domain-containing protein 4 isoform X2 n=1 Tax=Syngnathus acus TaxID=161584 RepID=UPI001885F3AB|nr:fibronectin type III domain-containing protein 4 isoform X2 [Syngnathus acus]
MTRPLVVIHSAVLLLFGSDVFLVRANRPPAPVNVSVIHLSSDSATVSWEVPEGDVVIGFSVSQQVSVQISRYLKVEVFTLLLQRQDRHTQRFIREVNTSSRACVLWDLQEDTDYVIQVQSIGLYGESQASEKVHFRTLKKTERFPSNSSNQDDPTVQGLERSRHLQTGELIIIVVVLLMWAAVIALFCRQYDIIKDNDSSNNKEKVKPTSERSTPEHRVGKFHPSVPSINIIQV